MCCAPAARGWPRRRSSATCSRAPLAVLVARWLGGRTLALVAALGAFLGHLFPVWLGFKGGKGVATYIGVLLGLAWPAALVFGVVWLAVAAVDPLFVARGPVASAADAGRSLVRSATARALLFVLLTLLLWIMHRANIARLIAGTEGKIGESAGS